jgi:hypothetical protein
MLYDVSMDTRQARPRLMPEAKHELHVQVPVTMRDQVWAAAARLELSPSQWLRRAIRLELEREGP